MSDPAPLQPFHLAIAVDDLDAAERFYSTLLGCDKGRQSPEWIDFNFYGHQLVTHLSESMAPSAATNEVDGKAIPVNHFGLILSPDQWRALLGKLTDAGQAFLVEATIRFAGQPGEQGTFFIKDPAGNALEFKYFEDIDALFRT